MTVEKLRAAMDLLPRPVGFALLVGSRYVDKIYRLDNILKVDSHLYMLVVPKNRLHEFVAALGASPYLPMDEGYRFNIYKQKKAPSIDTLIGVVNYEAMA